MPTEETTNNIRPETIISLDRIVFLSCPSKREALLALVDNISTAPQIKNPKELSFEILKREELMSTAIGLGIAIPHVRLSSITDLVVSVGINQRGIHDFQTLDDEPVRLLLMIAAAYNQHAYYLQTLSFFSARLKNLEFRTALLKSKNPEQAFRILVGNPV